MKTTHPIEASTALAIDQPRYEVYRQNRAGNFVRTFESSRPLDAMLAFLDTTPAFEGGEVRIWDRQQERLLAAAEWTVERTGMGFYVRTRKNVFHDDEAAALARLVAQREALVQVIAHELRLSA
jgi:hypothetical protein